MQDTLAAMSFSRQDYVLDNNINVGAPGPRYKHRGHGLSVLFRALLAVTTEHRPMVLVRLTMTD